MPSRAALAVGLWALWAWPASGQAIERVLAVVDDTPVLQSEVVLLGKVRGLAPQAALQALIDETLMEREASRLPEAAVSPEEEMRAVLSLSRSVAAETLGALDTLGLRALARRQTAILKYVELRFRPQVRVDDEEVFHAYETRQAGRASASGFEAQAPQIREELQARALDARIEAWVAELRAAARIRLVPSRAGSD